MIAGSNLNDEMDAIFLCLLCVIYVAAFAKSQSLVQKILQVLCVCVCVCVCVSVCDVGTSKMRRSLSQLACCWSTEKIGIV